VTLADAVELKRRSYPATTLLALRGETPTLIQQGIHLAKGKGETALYCLYVEEWPGLFNSDTPHRPNEEGIRTLRAAVQAVRDKKQSKCFRSGRFPTMRGCHRQRCQSTRRRRRVDWPIAPLRRFYHMLRGHVVKD